MVFNLAGLLAVAEVVFRPHLLVPKLVVEDIRALKLHDLKARGVIGVVLDKDNCLTKPNNDALVQELRGAWPALIKTFGRENVLIVSNSAGTRDDAGFLQAESVSRHLGVPVLLHSTKKPGCAKTVQEYFQYRQNPQETGSGGRGRATLDQVAFDVAAASLFSSETPYSTATSSPQSAGNSGATRQKIMVIGDRVMTDVVLANRINKKRWRQPATSFEAIPVLTTRLWQTEGLGTRFMRAMETFAMRRASSYYRAKNVDAKVEWNDCVIHPPSPVPETIPMQAPRATRRPLNQYFSKQYLRQTAFKTGHGIAVLLAKLVSPILVRIKPVLQEARQAHYGFRVPEGYKRTKLLREVLEGRQGIVSKK
ncbi:hypothetical protein P389DRAFT_108095 [Cystobasidium minutum MCA 4210]|uniref:uncharacterized protein n=1 Tax=Cystobasidium minutum MCA 4210 TaxID=1397322 RepID=UPI0034CD9E6F|eukprot:jgi/Rhomi1/108095/CE108094_106